MRLEELTAGRWHLSDVMHKESVSRESLCQVPVALYWTLGGFSYPLGTQNLSVLESREDEYWILSTLPYDRATSEVSIPSIDPVAAEMQTPLILS